MGLEAGTYISDLNSSNPAASDVKSQGDDHLRLIKSTIKASFPNVTGAVSASHTELSYAAGATSALQTQINNIIVGTIPARVVNNVTTTPTTMGSNQDYSYNMAGLTLNLPAAPANGDKITVVNKGTNIDCIIGRNGKNIMGSAANMTVDIANFAVTLEYVNGASEADWRIV